MKIFFFFFLSLLFFSNAQTNLTDHNFDLEVQNALNTPWIVMFYAPWCPHCKKMLPTWEYLHQNFLNVSNYGLVNCENNTLLKDRFSITGYPSFIFFVDGKMIEYSGSRDVESIINFITHDHKSLEMEDIPKGPDFFKKIKKHFAFVFDRVKHLVQTQPYLVGGFVLFLIVFIFAAFWLMDWGLSKLEERERKKVIQKKET